VVEVGFLVEVLPGKSERELERAKRGGVFIGNAVSERLDLIPPPYRRTGSLGDQAGCVQVSSRRRAFVVAGSISLDAFSSCSS
jgi:hypothetical protein